MCDLIKQSKFIYNFDEPDDITFTGEWTWVYETFPTNIILGHSLNTNIILDGLSNRDSEIRVGGLTLDEHVKNVVDNYLREKLGNI